MSQAHTTHTNIARLDFWDRHGPFAFDTKAFSALLLNQVHGTDVVYRSRAETNLLPRADGQWTDQAGISLAIRTADCVPLLLSYAHPKRPWVAALHCGWRSGLGGIAASLLTQLRAEKLLPETASGEHINVWAGPSIHACCFQVGPEVLALGQRTLEGLTSTLDLQKWASPDARPNRWRVNLLAHYRAQWDALGVPTVWDTSLDLCTYCDPEKFFSYRREGRSGSLLSVITLHDS